MVSIARIWTVEVCVRSKRSVAYKKALERHSRPHRRELRKPEPDGKLVQDIIRKAAADGLVVDWRGLTESGEDVPFTPEKAEELFRDRELQALFDFVVECAEDDREFRVGDEEDAGNSESA